MKNNDNGIIARQLEYVGQELIKEGRVAVNFFGGYISELAKILDEADEPKTRRPWSVNEERSKLL
jgi:hypothetical protein